MTFTVGAAQDLDLPEAAFDIVTCTLATKLRFHTGSRKELANRKYKRFSIGSLPR